VSPLEDVIEVNPAERLPGWARRFVDSGHVASDDPTVRLRKRMLLMVVLLSTVSVTVVVAATLAVGDPRSAIAPSVYLVGSLAGVAHLVRTRRIGVLLTSQLVMVLLLPALQQWLLGGFVASAASILYAVNAALLAVVLVGARAARWWLAAFAALVVASGIVDSWLVANVRPADVPVALFFVVTILVVGLLAWLPLAFFVESRRRLVEALDARNAELAAERARSEALLLTILPSEVAQRLKAGERPIADLCPEVAVLFADIVGFTPLSSTLAPEEVIAGLNDIFTRFDRLAAEHGLAKVKTIGDAYMVVAGAPQPRPDAVDSLTRMALDMREATTTMTFGGQRLVMRIGMDVGPVVAGVIGEARFAWDLYGDAVNTAARMESHGVPGQIHVTERFARRMSAQTPVRRRGPLAVKGKGVMTTYLVDARSDDAATRAAQPSP
jgi:adenylate cyclase